MEVDGIMRNIMDLRAEEAELDEVLSSFGVVWRPQDPSRNRMGGEYVRKTITLRRLVELVADEMERRSVKEPRS